MLKNGFSYSLIQKFAVLYLVVWTISPPLSVDLTYRLIALACAGIWFAVWFIRENTISFGADQLISLIFLVMVVGVVYLETGSVSSIIKQISTFMLIICYLINYFYRDRWDELSGIVPIVLILLSIWNFKTANALELDPTIARALVRDDEATYEYLRQGIGGYNLIYPQVCLSPLILAWIFKAFSSNRLFFALGVVYAVSYVSFITTAGYSIAIVATVVGAIILLFYKGKSGIAAFLVAIGLFITVMLMILYVDSFRNFLLEFFDGTAVAKKINDLVSVGETGESGESIQVRIDAYSASLKELIRYPVIGSLWRPTAAGGHSAFLDTFAKYGLFGIYVFSKIVYSVPKYYNSKYDDKFIRSASNAVMITYLFVTVLDTVTYNFNCMVLIVASLLFEDIIKWSDLKNESVMDR